MFYGSLTIQKTKKNMSVIMILRKFWRPACWEKLNNTICLCRIHITVGCVHKWPWPITQFWVIFLPPTPLFILTLLRATTILFSLQNHWAFHAKSKSDPLFMDVLLLMFNNFLLQLQTSKNQNNPSNKLHRQVIKYMYIIAILGIITLPNRN